jgi:tetratricopeptide (TPR) repeat protein
LNFAGLGLENVTSRDLIIPRLTIIQALSPQVKSNKPEYIAGAKVGDICDVSTGELFDPPLIFLPVHYMKQPSRAISRKLAEAIALLQRSEFAAARAAFGSILKLDPRNFDALHFAGIAAAQMGHFEEGEALIRRAVEINPRHAAAQSNHGSALMRLNRHEDALTSLDRAIALDPKAANAHQNRGVALMRMKRLKDSVAAFDRAIALNPDNAESHNDRACALMDQYKQLINEKIPITYQEKDLLPGHDHLNRHEVLHGVSISYPSEINAYRAVSWLQYVASFKMLSDLLQSPLHDGPVGALVS